jgi:ribonuclease HII
MIDFEIERELKSKGYRLIAGVDEAGRGPLAGPVCAAAVILPDNFCIDEINDSKRLTERKREELYSIIIENCIAYSVETLDHKEIDLLNIRNAAFAAMSKAVYNLHPQPDYVIIDGNAVKWIELPHSCIVKGDGRSASIAAASILAKVTRDRIMAEYDKKYPNYGFAKHKGYPTKQHYEALRKFGISPIHRMSFNLKV